LSDIVPGEPENTTWGAINEGDVVIGTNNSLWSVSKRSADGSTTLINVMTGKTVTSTPDDNKSVVRQVKAAHTLHVAKALATVMLGAEELGTKLRNTSDEWLCPVDFAHPGAMCAHLLVYHGVFGSAVAGRPLPALVAMHVTIHDPENRAGGYTPHVHDPEYAKRVALV
jgi:hypothetical protein